MSLSQSYAAFKANLDGYVEVPFAEFRAHIAPLRRQRVVWPAGDVAYIRGLAAAGAGFALQEFFGSGHAAAAAALRGLRTDREPMSKADLDDHMRYMAKNCLARGWPAARFRNFAAYLASDMTPKQLVEADREERRQQVALLGAPQTADDWDDGEAPDSDNFASMFRGAGVVFQSIVTDRLMQAAAAADKAAKKT